MQLVSVKDEYSLLAHNDAGRKVLERLICRVYKKVYNAEISFFHHYLLSIKNEGLEGVIGFSPLNQPVFLEQYLELPLEKEISRLVMFDVSRASIAEVGNLAAIKGGSGVKLIIAMTECLLQKGFEYGSFTGTKQIFSFFNKFNYMPLVLTCADPGKVANISSWGSYYNYCPKVAVVDLRALKVKLQQFRDGEFNEIFEAVSESLSGRQLIGA